MNFRWSASVSECGSPRLRRAGALLAGPGRAGRSGHPADGTMTDCETPQPPCQNETARPLAVLATPQGVLWLYRVRDHLRRNRGGRRPGGSAAATFLARAGKRVLVLEKEHFPRFHIGESLLPYNHRVFAEMGVLPTLEAAGFLPKLAHSSTSATPAAR